MNFLTSVIRGEPAIVSVQMTTTEIEETKVIRFPSKIGGVPIKGVSMADVIIFGNAKVKVEFDEGIEFCEGFCESNITEVTFPRSMKLIGTRAFYGCKRLTKVNFPKESQLTMISKGAFDGSAVKELILPASLESIKYEAFRGIKGLKRVTFEDGICSLKLVEVNAFFDNETLEYVEFPKTTEYIAFGSYVFYNCFALKEVVFKDNNVTHFNPQMFSNCSSLTKVTIPQSLEVICKEAFAYSGIKSLDCSNTSLKIIEASAFKHAQIESIILPDTVTCIGTGAFQFSGLNKIKLPASLKRIEDEAFLMSSLSEIENIEQLKELIYLGDGAFQNCNFTSLTIPNIDREVAIIVGDLFSHNILLESVVLEEGNTMVCSDMFRGCTKLKNIKLPNTVKEIRYRAFQGCEELSVVEWSKAITFIGDSAFRKTAITELIANSDELYIDNKAFMGCPNLKTITLSPYATYCSDSFSSKVRQKLEKTKVF